MDPVVWFRDKPAGSEGEMLHEVAGDPELRGVILVIAMSLQKLYVEGLTEIFGASGTTDNRMVVETFPEEFVAVTVYVSIAVTRSGVPVISPFCVLKLNPDGRPGVTDHVGNVPTTVG